MKAKFILISLISLIGAGSFFTGAYLSVRTVQFQPLSVQEKERIRIRPGESLNAIAYALHQKKILNYPKLWVFWAWLHGQSRLIQAGDYAIIAGMSAEDLLSKMVAGEVLQYDFTIIPGWTFQQLLTALHKDSNLKHELQDLSAAQVMEKLGLAAQDGQGQFFPETYRFLGQTRDIDILKRAHQLLVKNLAKAWRYRAVALPLKNPQEALILASLVEREGKFNRERPLIASVFYNRLEKNMRLQTDPSVIFAMGDKYQGKITRRDLRIDSPYNTYRYKGLPPGPIAMVSEASLHATLHPLNTPYLYFVARGDGSHVFSKTLKEHNQAVKRYILDAHTRPFTWRDLLLAKNA
ncbi:endolytic transglycosylase MltG [Piscirickettsia salmonis]|uniref:endolytic transglycosylase MltG n=1 Tax=Piscirickettsia salmonis TaxID=1238 RepID=UPI0007C8DB91|nr:putative aminodeoxychorismate lyase [Piscirickettsiaceae bacterium NZ-RLO1]